MPEPQVFPLGALPLSMHFEAPVAQVVLPSLQADGSQAMPATQAVHSPLLHTRPVPQPLPLGALPLTLQTDVPVVHEVRPTLHGSLVVHGTSGVQGAQVPLLQTMFVPQAVPLGAFVPVSVHIGAPLSQVSAPTWHLLAGTQLDPALQATQVPWLHTRPSPQALPFGASPANTHMGPPLLQSIFPSLQASLAMSQAMPA
jgi:hypothetical protein